jgi:hypothetical protein
MDTKGGKVTYRDDAKALMAHDTPKSCTVIIPIKIEA